MPEVPKIVTERLKAGVAAGPHPDADVLTAFTEQSLPARERESVLFHLTACAECREIIALSLPVSEIVSEQEQEAVLVAAARPPRDARKWFTWPNLSWAGLAAGVVFAVAVLSMRHLGVREAAMVVPKAQPPTVQSSAPQANAASAEDKLKEEVPRSAELRSDITTKKLSAEKNAPAPAVPLRNELASDEFKNSFDKRDSYYASIEKKQEKSRSDLGTSMVGGTHGRLPLGAMSEGVSSKPAVAPGSPSRVQSETVQVAAANGNAAAVQLPATPPQAQREVTVSGDHAATTVAQESKDLDSLNSLNEPSEAVTKAKPPAQLALQTLEAQKSPAAGAKANMMGRAKTGSAGGLGTAAANPQWSVVGGALLRSMDAGKTWQTSLRSDPPLSCFAVNGAQVWAGGKGGIVYLSQDAGASWTQLHPTSGGATLTGDVTNIDLSGLSVILSAGNEIWTSIDTGKSWTKK